MTQAMIDLETLGTASDACIVSIGAVAFDNNRVVGEFYARINLDSAIAAGGVVSGDTIKWWMKQSDEARGEFQLPTVSIKDALESFAEWCKSHNIKEVWGNGSDFDNVILAGAYARMGIEPPWKFYNNRCYRTIKNIFSLVKAVRGGVHHNALDDARTQAVHLIEILKELEG